MLNLPGCTVRRFHPRLTQALRGQYESHHFIVLFLKATILSSVLALCLLPQADAALLIERSLNSPDGTLLLQIERDSVTSKLAWSVTRNGTAVITRGDLGIEISGTGVVAQNGPVVSVEARDIDTTWTPPYGEQATIRDHCREEIFKLPGTPQAYLELRAYNEGVALRYRVEGTGTFTLISEKTSFPLPATTQVWSTGSAQGAISKVAIGSAGSGLERPLTAEVAPDLYLALGEAGMRNHARMKFSRSGASTLLPALAGNVTYSGGFTTPWRYVRAASSPIGLLEGNSLMANLNAPSEVADTSWIKPGKVLREVTLTTQGGMACVDWAAEHGVEFIMFDAGWYGAENSASSDATEVNVDPARSPGPLDLPGVIAYAKSKNVGVILYVNQIALTPQLAEIVPLYEQWGVAGIKFGFVNVGSQSASKWLHDAIALCGQHHLMVNVHDEYRGTGLERTLPNFMTCEGVRGDEESPKNEDVLRTIFTRSLAGPADQTNCYFASRVDTMGSHVSQMAKALCVYSPWQYVYWYDRPPGSPGSSGAGGSVSVLRDVPELSFYERMPTVWDETRWLDGYPGTHATVARRKGDAWYLGSLNGGSARNLDLPLSFLTAGQRYRVELFTDDSTINTVTKVRIDTGVVDANGTLTRSLGIRRGLTAIFTPTNDPLQALPPEPEPPGQAALPAGTIKFEISEGYPAAGTDLAGTAASNAPFDGIKGWSRSTSSALPRIVATSDSGEYVGGQALGSSNSGTFIGGVRGIAVPGLKNMIRFDAQYYTGLSVGLMHDGDGDALFDANGDTGMAYGVGGTGVKFQARHPNFGTEILSPVTGSTGNWYRIEVTVGDPSGGQREITMAVRNLTTASDVDFDSATAGVQPWKVQVADSAYGFAPNQAEGVFVRLTSSAKVDNLLVTSTGMAGAGYLFWLEGFPALATSAQRAAAADPDGDGVGNLLEFVLGGDPGFPEGSKILTEKVGENVFQVSFPRSDESEGDLKLKVQYSEDLGVTEWNEFEVGAASGNSGAVQCLVEERGSEADWVTVSLPMTLGPELFVRLVAEQL